MTTFLRLLLAGATSLALVAGDATAQSATGRSSGTSSVTTRSIGGPAMEAAILDGRRARDLAAVVPGSPIVPPIAGIDTHGDGTEAKMAQPRVTTWFAAIDGAATPSLFRGHADQGSLSIEFIEQETVSTGNLRSAFARQSGVAVGVVTRSGTNAFAGSAFDLLRRDGLDANDWFSNQRHIPKALLASDNFGFNLGGPLVRNRAFFFGGVEWNRLRRQSGPAVRSLPTSAMRRGDFSAISIAVKNPATGQAFPDSRIPWELMTDDGRAIAAVYEAMARLAASYDDTRSTNNALFLSESPTRSRQETLRLDIRTANRRRLSARLVLDDTTVSSPFGRSADSQLPIVPTERLRADRQLSISDSWSATDSLVLETRLTATTARAESHPIGAAWRRTAYGFTFPQLFGGDGDRQDAIPDVTIGGFAGFGGADGSPSSLTRDVLLEHSATWMSGRHTLKVGGLFEYARHNVANGSGEAGSISFATRGNPMSSGFAFADALLGNFRTYRETAASPADRFRSVQVEAFADDEWRVGNRLTVEAGVRYTRYAPATTLDDTAWNFVPTEYDPAAAVEVRPDGSLVPGIGDRLNGLTPASFPTRHLVAPRAGLTWSSAAPSPIVVRIGVGLAHDPPGESVSRSLVANPPATMSSTYQNGRLADPGSGTVPALGPWATVAAVDTDMAVPSTWTWTVNVQRDLPWLNLRGDVSVVGSRGTHQLRRPDINAPTFDDLTTNTELRYSTDYWRPFSGFSQILMWKADGWSNEHSLQVGVSRRRGRFDFAAHYTLARAFDVGASNSDGYDPGAAGLDYYYGPSAHDRRHVFVTSWSWRLPDLSGRRPLVAAMLGRWEFSGVVRGQSGTPLTVTGGTSIGTRRADWSGQSPYSFSVDRSTGTVTWLDAAQFSPAPEGRLGNSRRNQFVGPSFQSCDLAVRKTMALGPRVRLQVRVDLFNALNQVNFGNPAANLTGGTPFGTITSAASPRTVQLGVRLSY